ncbi:hypothetical protein [Halogeometricum sp. CBA1124]|uniref:hypothetical protein n=1 Tax=Halogeometricum sp. CBA1124 TaxID=2668071 RepID=UPI001429DE43|nr:hypothetical protein [Halogeometricum sp. CBA1124]MUV56518.1 hypothetical protein [Halogeometricum sp. CBA1124]
MAVGSRRISALAASAASLDGVREDDTRTGVGVTRREAGRDDTRTGVGVTRREAGRDETGRADRDGTE